MENIKGTAYIALDPFNPFAMFQDNNEFGDKNVVLKLSGNSGGYVISTDPSPQQGKKAKVFFEKDAPNQHEQTFPNWYYYWWQLITYQKLTTSPGVHFYEFNSNNVPILEQSTEYLNAVLQYQNTGKYKWKNGQGPQTAASMESEAPKVLDPATKSRITYWQMGHNPVDGHFYAICFNGPNRTLTIGEASGYWDVSDPSLKGIEFFYQNIQHEMHHLNLFCEMWTDGYNTSLDIDNDGYKDDLESSISLDPEKADYYDSNYKDFTKSTKATNFEKTACRVKQIISSKVLNSFDWSYDNKIQVQGINWKQK